MTHDEREMIALAEKHPCIKTTVDMWLDRRTSRAYMLLCCVRILAGERTAMLDELVRLKNQT